MDFKNFYKLPLKLDFDGDLVFTKDDVRAFDFNIKYPEYRDIKNQQFIIDIINNKNENKNKIPLVYSQGTIYVRGKEKDNTILKEFIIIRGFGHLTGTLKLTDNKAKVIQDNFAKFIIKQLS